MSFASRTKTLVPFAVRVEVVRLRRLPAWLRERSAVALAKEDPAGYSHSLAGHESPLLRDSSKAADPLQKAKERNVALAATKIDGIVVQPGQVFSYHHAVGRPSRLRGFRYGLELQNGRMSKGIGGGCCQVSNMLYLLALRAGMEIVERHRHALDLFPDHGRTVPFGCGATVFYNTSDLRFRNLHPFPVQLAMDIKDGALQGSVRAAKDPGWSVEIYEVEHHFHKEGDAWFRENRIRRRFTDDRGTVTRDEEVAHNVGRCLYDPENPE